MALSTLHAGDRRMLAKSAKVGRRVLADKELDVFFSAVPGEPQRMEARWRIQSRVKHVGERLFDVEWDTIQLECPTRGGRDDIHRAVFKRRSIRGSKNLPDVLVRGTRPAAYQTKCSGKDQLGHPSQNQSLKLNWISLGEPTV